MAPETTPLVADRDLPKWAEGPRLREVAVKTIVPSTTNPRKTYEDLEDLTASIRTHGVLQPIILRPVAKGKMEIVAGERRWRSAKKAGLKMMPARVEPFTADEAREVQIIENLQRTDLTVLEEATGFKALLAGDHYDIKTLAKVIGKSVSFITTRIRLLTAHPMVLDALGNGRIEAGHVLLLSRLDPEVQLDVLERGCLSRGWEGEDGAEKEYVSVRALAGIVKSMTQTPLTDVPWSMIAVYEIQGLKPKEQPPACGGCSSNTAVQGGLFADIHEPDICNNPLCYARKWAELLREARDTEDPEHTRSVFIACTGGRFSDTWWSWRESMVSKAIEKALGASIQDPSNYSVVPKAYTGDVPDEALGVVAWSSVKKHKIGTVIRISKRHGWIAKPGEKGAPITKTQLEEKEKTKLERAKNRLFAQAQTLAFDAVRQQIRTNVCWPPQDAVVLRLVRSLVDYLWDDDFTKLALARGWVTERIEKTKAGKERVKLDAWAPNDKKVHDAIAALDNQDLLGLGMEASLIKQLTPDAVGLPYRVGSGFREELRDLGKVLEYDLAAELRKAKVAVMPKKKVARAKKKTPARRKASTKKKGVAQKKGLPRRKAPAKKKGAAKKKVTTKS